MHRFATRESLKRALTLPDRHDEEGRVFLTSVKHVVIRLDYIEPGDGSETDKELTEDGGPAWGKAFWEGNLAATDANGQNLLLSYPAGYPFLACDCHFGAHTLESACFNAWEVAETFAAFGIRARLRAYQDRQSRVFGYRPRWKRALLRGQAHYWGIRGFLRDVRYDLEAWWPRRNARQRD